MRPCGAGGRLVTRGGGPPRTGEGLPAGPWSGFAWARAVAVLAAAAELRHAAGLAGHTAREAADAFDGLVSGGLGSPSARWRGHLFGRPARRARARRRPRGAPAGGRRAVTGAGALRLLVCEPAAARRRPGCFRRRQAARAFAARALTAARFSAGARGVASGQGRARAAGRARGGRELGSPAARSRAPRGRLAAQSVSGVNLSTAATSCP
jgi:hypothetical protein